MNKKSTITPLGWICVISLLVSLVNPVAFGICAGVWFGYAIIKFANTLLRENRFPNND
ncbi:MAG: hypothetical protein JST62_09435 [Bacteroidetes bacterium]|nr:hypothetical protein [Bacteroidota bacterium]